MTVFSITNAYNGNLLSKVYKQCIFFVQININVEVDSRFGALKKSFRQCKKKDHLDQKHYITKEGGVFGSAFSFALVSKRLLSSYVIFEND